MKRVIYYLFGLAALVFFNNLINTIIVRKGLDLLLTNQYHISGSYVNSMRPKIILIGSSTTKTGYFSDRIITELGLNDGEFLNLATMPNNAEINLQILENLGEKLDGSIVMYGLDPWIFSENYYQHFNYKLSKWDLEQRFMFAKNKFPAIGKSIDAINGGNLYGNLLLLFQQHELITDGRIQDINNEGPDANASMDLAKWFNYPDYGWSLDFFRALSSIDSLCYRKGSQLFLYVPTYSNSFLVKYRKLGFHDMFTQHVKRSVVHAHVDLFMRSAEDSQFCDAVHVNAVGKELHTKRIINILKQMTSRKIGQSILADDETMQKSLNSLN